MKLKLLVLLVGLVVCGAVRGQEREQKTGPPPERPTLGPPPAPSLHGPHTSTTTDPRKLMRIRNVFIERIDNYLSDRLVEGLAKTGRFKIVLNRKEADAVLSGSCADLPRLKTVHSTVSLNDRSTGASIWQDDIRRRFNPPPLQQVVEATAGDIVQHLGDSITEAQRKQ